jgi:hypothetical protein
MEMKMIISKTDFPQPAILLGNGLNNHVFTNTSWTNLLNQLTDDVIPRSYFNHGDLSYPEFFDALSFNSRKGFEDYESLKNKVCKRIIRWEGTPQHHKFTEFVRENNIPVVTTNFDLTLIDHKMRDAMKMKSGDPYKYLKPRQGGKVEGNTTFTDYYPWNTYYSDNVIENAPSQFAIWHMHGIACYKRSLAIGAIDYGNNISRYKSYIGNQKEICAPEWNGKNTWLDIFFHCDLVIIGLSLDSQETNLRWLLMEREKYFRKYQLFRKNTVFVTNKELDSVGEGKKYFLNSIGIKVVEKVNGKEIYDEWGLID